MTVPVPPRKKSTVDRDLFLIVGLPGLAVIALFFFAFPRGTFDEAAPLIGLARQVMSEFGEPGVKVNVRDSGAMTILLVNSTLPGLDSTGRLRKATAIARYGAAHWTGTAKLTSVSVGYITTSGAPGFQMTRTETPYSFDATQLAAWAADTSAIR